VGTRTAMTHVSPQYTTHVIIIVMIHDIDSGIIDIINVIIIVIIIIIIITLSISASPSLASSCLYSVTAA
jgi:hypothetical protein